MNRAKHLVLATAAGDAQAPRLKVQVTPREKDDPAWLVQGRAIDSRVALQEQELLKLRQRCRARELALARMAGALATLRRANRALNDENGLLRQQLAELKHGASSRAMARGSRPVVSDGE